MRLSGHLLQHYMRAKNKRIKSRVYAALRAESVNIYEDSVYAALRAFIRIHMQIEVLCGLQSISVNYICRQDFCEAEQAHDPK